MKKTTLSMLLILTVSLGLLTSCSMDEKSTEEEIVTEEASCVLTYESDVAVKPSSDEEETVETTTKINLSDSVDKVLASGYDNDGDFYELVANETENYEGVSVEIGVIKNNEWLLNPTCDMPLVDKDKTIYGTNLSGLNDAPETIYFIGNGCFLYRNIYSWGCSGETYQEIIYNADNGKYCELVETDKIESNRPSVIIYDDYSVISYKHFKNNGMKVNVSDSELVIWQFIQYDRGGPEITFLNTTTMQTQKISLEKCGPNPRCYPLSDGWFAVTNYYGDFKFYDTTGRMVLDLSSYKLTHNEQRLFFVDGKCTFTIYNNNNNIYEITIDKEGNVIHSKEL